MSQTDLGSIAAEGDVLQELVCPWAQAAVSCATVEWIQDPDGFVATISGLAGPWAFGESKEAALKELESVLRDWAAIKLADGDDDIPPMKGIHPSPPL
ncbi:type II toxin-antitoxin system HicB family antitoxin [Candidatus Poriferisocius sp.]|uniref:type II toxin-antitoxin system HicB family antitoxin n=1 Tax=Candidatus Poriferisocius sp. TaxID=3101276 RepID=UPI003B51A39E